MSLVFVLLHSAVNALVTWILVESFLFKGLQTKIRNWGCRKAQPRLDARKGGGVGEKLAYLVSCPLCLGVWVGFAQAWYFGGPFSAKLAVVTIAYNGLVFKAFGHVFYQLLAALHFANSWLCEQARSAKAANRAEEGDGARRLAAVTK